MKIWFDKNKLNLSEFKSEKFLFLPLYDNAVISKDKDFLDNKWADIIQDNITYSSLGDAEYIIYHDKYNSDLISFVHELQDYNHKPILAFFNDDRDIPISDSLPDNIYVFRTSINKSKQKLNEFSMPAWSSDFGVSEPRKLSTTPTVSFCGSITHPVRDQCIEKLTSNENIKTSFIFRNSFWGGKPHDPELRQQYIANIRDSDMVLCCRGAGNFSYRLYEVLSCGRIPIIVDTDISLPCENVVDWNKFIITTPENINKDIKRWWDNITDDEYRDLQQYSRFIYESYLSPAGFTKYISKHNTFRTYIRSSGMGLYNLFKEKGTITGVEIGVHEGVNATFLLETLPNLNLVGIDPYDSYIDWNGLDINYNYGEFMAVKLKGEEVESKFERFKILKLTSDDAVSEFEDNSLDFVFVDGLHTYEQTLQDCINYLPKVKPGGIIGGHDYGIIADVTKAVNEFSAMHNKEIKELKSTTRAWYWVKD